MLICINCEIEVEEGSAACPQCGGPLDEVLDDELDDLEEDEEYEDDDEYEEEEEQEEGPPAAVEAVEEAAPAEPPSEAPDAEIPADAAPAEPPSEDGAPPEGETPEEEKKRLRRERLAEKRAARGKKEPKEKKERKPREKKERKPREKKDKTSKRGKGKKEKEPAKPKAPKSIWLSQRRAPVLLATFTTLFLSLYLLTDFTVSVLVSQLHALWIILGLGGLLATLFLWGHGKLGRLGAFILGISGLAAAVFFKFNWSLENYLFLAAMVSYNVLLLLTLLGKGWFLRTTAGFVFALLVVVGCSGSLVLDFLPSVAKKRAEEALDTMASAEGSLDQSQIDAAKGDLEEAMAMYEDILQYMDKIPFEKMPPSLAGVVYFLLGKKRVSGLYSTPVLLQRKTYQHAPMLLDQADPEGLEVTFEGREWIEIEQPGVEMGTVRVYKPGRKDSDEESELESPTFVVDQDYEVEYGGLFGTTRVRRMAIGNIADGTACRLKYKYFNSNRDTMLDEAWKYITRAKDFLTGAKPEQIGPAIGLMFGEGQARVNLSNRGRVMLENFLYFDSQYVWANVNRSVNTIQDSLKEKDPGKLAKGKDMAAEVKAFFDDQLFNTLGWMIEKLDPEDDKGNTARALLGLDEYAFLYYNYSRLHWALYVAGAKESKEDFEEARSQMVTMKEIVTAGEPVKFISMAERIKLRYESRDVGPSKLWAARWKLALELDDKIKDEQERLDRLAGEAPKREELVTPADYEVGKDANNQGIYRWKTKDFNVFAKEVTFHFEIRDPGNLLEGAGKQPFFRNLQLRRDLLNIEVCVVSAGSADKVRLVLKKFVALDDKGNEGKKFKVTDGSEWEGGGQDILNPVIEFEQWEKEELQPVPAVKLVIEVSRAN